MKEETRNSKVLRSFVKYAKSHPEERFWQLLLNWSELPYIYWMKDSGKTKESIGGDTYYWSGRIEDKL